MRPGTGLAFLVLSLCPFESLAKCKPGTCQAKEVVGNQLVQKASGIRRAALLSLGPGEASAPEPGRSGCGCVGVDWPEGTVQVSVGLGEVAYPSNIGSSCQPWDYGRHPECRGHRSPSWCKRSWCFVDGCDCNLTSPPKVTTYLPNSTYQGRKVYYSYSACGEEDDWTVDNHESSCVNQHTEERCLALGACSWTSARRCVGKELAANAEVCGAKGVEDVLGSSECKCIGFSNTTGTIPVMIGDVPYNYPGDFGSYCSAWDHGHHPSCNDTVNPAWCEQKWCYVDPCSCNASIVPKRLTYLDGATFQGKPLYYSYDTCGSADNYSATENAGACANHATAPLCWTMIDCIWTADRGCMHKDFADLCGAVPVPVPSRNVPPQLPEGNGTYAPLPIPESDNARAAQLGNGTVAPLPAPKVGRQPSAPPGTAAPTPAPAHARHHHSGTAAPTPAPAHSHHHHSGTAPPTPAPAHAHHHAGTTPPTAAPAHAHHHHSGDAPAQGKAAPGRPSLLAAAAAAAAGACALLG